jgi:hypothetical protein
MRILISCCVFLALASAPVLADSSEARRFYAPPATGDLNGGRMVDYEVKEGETLFHIAERFLGSPYRAEALAKANQIADPLHLKPGTRIKVPAPRAGLLYSIEKLTPEGELKPGSQDTLGAGDRFMVRVSANAEGYLYLFDHSSKGAVTRIFPASGHPQRIKAFSEYLLPVRGGFLEVGRAGSDAEEVWIVLATEPLPELDAALDHGVLEAGMFKSYDSEKVEKGIVISGDAQDEPEQVVEGNPREGRLLVVHVIKIRRK